MLPEGGNYRKWDPLLEGSIFSEILGPQTLASWIAPNCSSCVPIYMSLLKKPQFLWRLAPSLTYGQLSQKGKKVEHVGLMSEHLSSVWDLGPSSPGSCSLMHSDRFSPLTLLCCGVGCFLVCLFFIFWPFWKVGFCFWKLPSLLTDKW